MSLRMPRLFAKVLVTAALPVCFIAALSVATQSVAQENASGDAVRGKSVYMESRCYYCHGRVGQGGQGPTLAKTVLPYVGFRQIVRVPYGAMPAYSSKVLADQDLQDIYAYVKSLPGPAKELPAILAK